MKVAAKLPGLGLLNTVGKAYKNPGNLTLAQAKIDALRAASVPERNMVREMAVHSPLVPKDLSPFSRAAGDAAATGKGAMMRKTASQIAGRVLRKCAFSVTERGHAFDADRAAILQDAMQELAARQHQEGALGGRVGEGGKWEMANLLKTLRFGAGDPRQGLRRQAYIEKKHRAGSNAWNPFGGALTPHPSEEHGTAMLLGKVRSKKDTGEEKISGVSASARINEWLSRRV
jgi:hypothetical protein